MNYISVNITVFDGRRFYVVGTLFANGRSLHFQVIDTEERSLAFEMASRWVEAAMAGRITKDGKAYDVLGHQVGG